MDFITRAPEASEFWDTQFGVHRGQLLSWSFIRKTKNKKTYFVKPAIQVTPEIESQIRSWRWKVFKCSWPVGSLKFKRA